MPMAHQRKHRVASDKADEGDGRSGARYIRHAMRRARVRAAFRAAAERPRGPLVRPATSSPPARPGAVLVHDFFVDDDRQGPRGAALWFVLFLFNPDAVSLTPGGLTAALAASGFTDVTVRDVIPGLTRLAIARKPA